MVFGNVDYPERLQDMKVSDLIAELERFKAEHGDLPVTADDSEYEQNTVDAVKVEFGGCHLTGHCGGYAKQQADGAWLAAYEEYGPSVYTHLTGEERK